MSVSAPAIKTIKVDDPQLAKRRLLPYQETWAADSSDLKLWEKSVRIGATWVQEFVAIRDRFRYGTDYLHSSATEALAEQFIKECAEFWLPIVGIVASSKGVETWMDEQEKKVFYIRFDNGTRILSFSSSPKSIRGFGGAVGLDEIAFHRDVEAMMAAAGTRIAWGGSLAMWSSHNGEDSQWNRLLTDERNKGEASQFSIHRTTVWDAIDAGLVEKINQVSGKNQSREQWLAKMRAAAGSEKNFREEFECIPQKKGTPLVSWPLIQASVRSYECLQVRLDGDDEDVSDAVTLDGKRLDMVNRCVVDFLADGRLDAVLAANKGRRLRVGYDVGRTGDLSSIYLEAERGPRWRLVANVLLHKCKFVSGYAVMRRVMLAGRCVGGADATGLGMQTAEELGNEFGERFAAVNFGSKKMELCTILARNYEAGLVERSADAEYAAQDVYSLKHDVTPGGRQTVVAGRNPLLPESHGDVAMSEAVATYASAHCMDLGPARGLTLSQAGAPADPRHAGDRDDLTRDAHYRTEGF